MNNNSLTSKVEINVSCSNLRNKDVLSKSDPIVVLSMKFGNHRDFSEYGRTEMVKDCLNPKFSHAFEIDYYFEEQQRLRFSVYDVDSKKQKLSDQDFLGMFECNLGELVSRCQIETKLTGISGNATINLVCSELGSCKEVLNIQMAGHKLDKKDLFSKSDPFVEIFRAEQPDNFQPNASPAPHSKFVLVHRTEVIKNTLDPSWLPFSIPICKICLGDKDRFLRFDCYDWDEGGNSKSSHDFIGSFYTCVNDIFHKTKDNHAFPFPLINEKKKQKKRDYNNSGTITFTRLYIEFHETFVDFISGGTAINFTVAVDFTASNGDPKNPMSLHYVDPSPYPKLNQYELTIRAVGEIIQDYDSDHLFPALGFGAKINPSDKQPSHCFPLTFRNDNPYCAGVEGLLATYKQAISVVKFYGPTNFSPVIDHVSQFAKQHPNGDNYFCLLIITDGIISDMQNTINSIIEASELPISIIIVGIGNEDFSAMNILDADDGPLRSGNKVAKRDMVQFVPIRDYMSDVQKSCKWALAKAVLAELPDQLTLWMRQRGIRPLPPRPAAPYIPPAVGDAGPPYSTAPVT